MADADKVHCPSCGIPYDAGTLICTRCGIDIRTGRPLRTTVGAAASDEKEADEGPVEYTAWEKFVMAVGAFVPGVFRPKVLIASILMICVAAVAGGFGLMIFSLGAVFAAVAVGATALILYAQAVAWVLIGRFALLQEALTEFDGKAWTIFSICVWGPFVALFAVAKKAMG